ncbi:hypothetical protein EDB86DRAFT_3243563 [Lactarius hatsudake]|nr:hypothetical protein EDB86DRAFT_3243563 [Lactarius hatsudake]
MSSPIQDKSSEILVGNHPESSTTPSPLGCTYNARKEALHDNNVKGTRTVKKLECVLHTNKRLETSNSSAERENRSNPKGLSYVMQPIPRFLDNARTKGVEFHVHLDLGKEGDQKEYRDAATEARFEEVASAEAGAVGVGICRISKGLVSAHPQATLRYNIISEPHRVRGHGSFGSSLCTKPRAQTRTLIQLGLQTDFDLLVRWILPHYQDPTVFDSTGELSDDERNF